MSADVKYLAIGLILGLLAGGIAGMTISAGSSVQPNFTIVTAGSTTVYPLSQEWATRFHNDFPMFSVNPSTGGSGLGQSQIASGLIDIGASSSYPSASYLTENPHVRVIPICADALAIVANPSVNGSTLHLDLDMVVAIFQRNVTTWEEFESTFHVVIQQTGPINVYTRADASGTTATLGKWLKTADKNPNPYANYTWRLGDSETMSWVAGTNAVEGNPGVASSVGSDSNGIGYVALDFIGSLTAAKLYNYKNHEYVTPSIENALKAIPADFTDASQSLLNSENPGAYPIARLLFYLVNTNRVYWYVLVYLNWCLVQGQAFVRNVGYVPINGTVVLGYAASVLGAVSPTG